MIRPLLVVTLTATGLKLLGASNFSVGIVGGAIAVACIATTPCSRSGANEAARPAKFDLSP